VFLGPADFHAATTLLATGWGRPLHVGRILVWGEVGVWEGYGGTLFYDGYVAGFCLLIDSTHLWRPYMGTALPQPTAFNLAFAPQPQFPPQVFAQTAVYHPGQNLTALGPQSPITGASIVELPTPQSSQSNGENTSSTAASSAGSSSRPNSQAGGSHQCPHCDKSYETLKKLSSVPRFILGLSWD
jgi:hypothetical protein